MDTALNGDSALRSPAASFSPSTDVVAKKNVVSSSGGFDSTDAQKLGPVLKNLAAGPGASAEPVVSGSGRIWGDPHFIGADGDKYDVQGQAGKSYNLLSDQGFQMNGRFDKWGDGDATVVGKVGIVAGANYIDVDKTGTTMVNGKELKDGERIDLRDGGFVERKGSDIHLSKGEWEVDFQTQGDHINLDVKTANANADGVLPHGLIGQTFDGDGKALTGDEGSGAQGGGVLAKADGSLSGSGDRSTVQSYEVGALWDTTFKNHNKDYGQQSKIDKMLMASIENTKMMRFSEAMQSFGEAEWADNDEAEPDEARADAPPAGNAPSDGAAKPDVAVKRAVTA